MHRGGALESPLTIGAIVTAVLDDAVRETDSQRDEIRGYQRSPRDVLRAVAYLTVTLALVAVGVLAKNSTVGFERDVVQVFHRIPDPAERVLVGFASMATFVVWTALLLVPAMRRRWRVLGYVALAAGLGNGAGRLVSWAVDRDNPLVDAIARTRGAVHSDLALTSATLATTAAMFVVVAPFVARRWHLVGAGFFALLVVVRLMVSVRLPGDVLAASTAGAVCGALVLAVLGRPDRRPTIQSVLNALRETGLDIAEVHPAKVDARGSTPYFATLADESGLFAKVLGHDERAADLLFRVYRKFKLKNVGDERPFSSLRRTVEHEALVSLQARDVGVRTPRMRGVVDVGFDSMMLAYDMIDGRSLDALESDAVSESLLRELWEQVAVMRRYRIAHRDLRRANVFVDSDGQPWIIDFGFAEVAASDTLLDADVAQLLCAVAILTDAIRSVDSAVDVLGADAVASALPRLQIAALSGATQTALKQRKGLLKEVQERVKERCAVTDVHFEPLQRLNRSTIFTAVLLVAVAYFLLPQFADLPEIADQVKAANWGWLPAMLVTSALTYVAAAVSISGSVPTPIAPGPTLAAQVGSSFASKLAPAGFGGMALNVRFLQKQGVESAVAVSGVGLNTVGGFAMHVVLLLSFVVWAGNSAFKGLSLPDPKWFALAAGVAVVASGIAASIASVRKLVREKLVPMIKEALGGIAAVARTPLKLIMLLAGSMFVTLSYIVCVYLATKAFGGTMGFAAVGAVYLTASAVATAAPTPGGLGALEAALIATLVAAGMDNAVAVPAVFLYRLCTFWLPILPGYVCFHWLRRAEYI